MSHGPNMVDLQDSVHTDLVQLFEKMQTCSHPLSDVIIKLRDGRNYYAHGWVLAFRSCYFQRMLECRLGESQTRCIRIEDEPYLIEQLLRYLYLGQVQFENLHQLLCLCLTADKYLVDRMNEALVEHVRNGWINQFTAVSIYRFSFHFEQRRLAQFATDYLLENGHQVLANRSLMNLPPKQLKTLIVNDDFHCIENDLLDFILAYISYYSSEYSGQIQVRTFDSTIVPSQFRLKLDDIGIETITMDPVLTNDMADNQDKLFLLNRSDQESLLQCIRPQALLQADNLIKSLLLIYDTRLVSWCNDQLHLADNQCPLRHCYPISNRRRYRIEPQSGLIRLQNRIFVDTVLIGHSDSLQPLSQCFVVFEYAIDNHHHHQQQQQWHKVASVKMRMVNQKTIEFRLARIIDALYIRLPLCNWISQTRAIVAEMDLNGLL
ncbi:uncharacterized protein LOC124499058 [Dermatophagoides farinae]|uniref:uncharacterized protein LOC124499058 n=1 Tax=Dermatophagoides farinae TaxID=6954 RepID=UPI003F6156F7